MFKHIKIEEQLRKAQGEVNRLKGMIGEFPKVEDTEEIREEEQKTVVRELEQKQADIDYIAIMTGVDM